MLQSRVYYRKTVFDKHFLATFPAINGLNTIVVGTPENTGLNSTGWVITVLHEHFHQFVYSRPGYYDAVGLLNLSGGDKTGMWMLNYPFPYADTGVDRAYGTYAETLARAVASIGTPSFATDLHSYLAARDVFESSLDSAAYRYFSFQIWQEGIARYTEYKFLQLLDSYKPSREFERLPDYVPFGKYRETFYRDQLKRITDWDLSVHQRECFYGIGFGEGLILDALNPRWRERYLTDKFYIEHYAVDVLKKQ
jgi:hypothetical protein